MDDQSQRIVTFECVGNNGNHPLPSPRVSVQRIAVPCSGKVQPEHLLKAFEAGADVVIVATCRNGECRYLEGRQRVERRLDYVRRLLDEIGLGGKRLILQECSGSGIPTDTFEALAEVPLSPLGKGNQGL
jgi:coenzyme F420-reducing hydrogenase delta subunit